MDNLYSAPRADLSNVPSEDETYSPQIISIHGRLGRLRYLAYTWISAILLSIVSGIVAAIAIPFFMKAGLVRSTFFVIAVSILIYLPIIAASLVYTKRRLNDLNFSGWLGLLMLIPFLNLLFGLYLVFAPGSSGNNRYGAKPEKNSGLLVVAGILLPLVMIGILAASAIPAYKNYIERAKAEKAAAAVEHQAP